MYLSPLLCVSPLSNSYCRFVHWTHWSTRTHSLRVDISISFFSRRSDLSRPLSFFNGLSLSCLLSETLIMQSWVRSTYSRFMYVLLPPGALFRIHVLLPVASMKANSC
jgi:hypothetical protein